MKLTKPIAAAAAGCLLCAAPALAVPVEVFYTIDFEGPLYTGPGSSINSFQVNTNVSGFGTTSVSGSISATGGTGEAWLYNTNPSSIEGDSDLEGPFYDAANRPNLTGKVDDFGNALIIQEPGNSQPDDHYNGGTLTFLFDNSITLHSATLLDSSNNADGVTFDLFKVSDLDNPFDSQSNEENGDSSGLPNPNWYEIVQFGTIGMGIEEVKKLVVGLNNVSGAIDNIVVSQTIDVPQNVVPIPAAAWLFASALGLFGYLGKRKSKA